MLKVERKGILILFFFSTYIYFFHTNLYEVKMEEADDILYIYIYPSIEFILSYQKSMPPG